jgi:hypothetical protein
VERHPEKLRNREVVLSSQINHSGVPSLIESSPLEVRTCLSPSAREVVRAIPLPLPFLLDYVLVIVAEVLADADVVVVAGTTIRGQNT